ncbi:TetR/AcrR family transcriptional regulator [Gordonia sp. TBRC 11910]|uniref:TetR/AcrR family transcriptional regulator n=1 Tax=Gordonia asplenii TaxID=2725283 RepID=A0A848KYK4_9ACTN|nr:TetR/AcrR family transcriptional regulator [Gordonia asplenii]NMO03814.1 TetR/AcrR family transcriptional regulator [Gordonia asplenii]
MTLTTKGLATRQRIIQSTAEYLRSNDPGSATLDDIRVVTRTSKGQLFHYFPGGKEQLWLEVARFEADRVLDDQQPYLGALDSWESWEQWRTVLVARYRAQGKNCPLATLMGQVGETGTTEVVTALLQHWEDDVRQGILKLHSAQPRHGGIDAATLAAAFIAGIQGGVSVLRTTGDTAHLEAVLDVLFAALRTSVGTASVRQTRDGGSQV